MIQTVVNIDTLKRFQKDKTRFLFEAYHNTEEAVQGLIYPLQEGTVEEISPNQTAVKIGSGWYYVNTIVIVDTLNEAPQYDATGKLL